MAVMNNPYFTQMNGSVGAIPQTPQIQNPQISNGFAWVQGEAAAKAFVVIPGTTVVLMDTENPVMYMKSTDASGRPLPMETRYLVSKEDFEKLQTIQNGSETETTDCFLTKEEFQSYMAELEKKFVVRKEKQNGKSSV